MGPPVSVSRLPSLKQPNSIRRVHLTFFGQINLSEHTEDNSMCSSLSLLRHLLSLMEMTLSAWVPGQAMTSRTAAPEDSRSEVCEFKIRVCAP